MQKRSINTSPILRSLGFHIAYKKVVSQNTAVTYLGVEIDSLKMELRLPQSKLDKLQSELEFFRDRKRPTLNSYNVWQGY